MQGFKKEKVRACLRPLHVLCVAAFVLVAICVMKIMIYSNVNIDQRPKKVIEPENESKSFHANDHQPPVIVHEPKKKTESHESLDQAMYPITRMKFPSSYLKFVHIFNTSLAHYSLCSKHLRPHDNRFDEERLCDNKKRAVEDIFRTGYGLKPYVTDRGEPAWIENGIVYRPYRQPKVRVPYEKHVPSEYEVYVPYNHTLFFEGEKHEMPKEKEKKIILWWTPARQTPNLPDLTPLRACPDFPCVRTTNRKYTKDSSAMVFFVQITNVPAPPPRTPDQVFVLMNNEPAERHNFGFPAGQGKVFLTPSWRKAFNWTMTYRMDSDILTFYGVVRKRPVPVVRDYKAILSKKTKKVAWFLSSCRQHALVARNEYVNELKKYIPVDIWGGCGTQRCQRKNDEGCLNDMGDKYKFYLSFENSLCVDYISEKLFRFMTGNVVIVARGIDTYYMHLPAETFINANDFNSPKELADHLLYLDKHDDEYLKILQEKDKYMNIYEDYPIIHSNNMNWVSYHEEAVPICELCQKLWNLDKYRKHIPDITKWWNEASCREAQDVANW